MNVAIVVPTYLNQAAMLHRLCTTIRETTSHRIRFYLFKHSSWPAIRRECERQVLNGDTTYFPFCWNRGLSRTWNDGLLLGYHDGADVVILSNDDIWVTDGDVDMVVDAAITHRECAAVTCVGYNHTSPGNIGLGFSFIAINPIALQTLGCFDENIYPCYWEDIDYVRRMTLYGMPMHTVMATNVQHLMGATRRSLSKEELIEFNKAATASKVYYDKKWGTDKVHPFGDSRYKFYIAPDDRHNPYPGYEGPGVQYAQRWGAAA
jgi:GT2 family glycosyltransferase